MVRSEVAELQRKWKPPAELIAPGERNISLSGKGIAMVVLASIFLLGGVGLGIGLELQTMRRASLQRQLSEMGQDVNAVLTRHWRTGGEDDSPMVEYQFETDRGILRGRTGAPDRIWKGLEVGSPLAVRFLPSDPSRNHPRDWPVERAPQWVILLASISLAGGGIIIALVLRKQFTLLRGGRPAPGIVTRYSAGDEGQKRVHFDFVLPGGVPESGKALRSSRRAPPIGAEVCVIYDPENPRRSALYPLDMVKIAGPSPGM